MRVLLLLAGRSRRFWPLTEKTLFPVCGKTLLEHQVERLRSGGCKDIILVGSEHNLEEARRIFPDLQKVEQEDLELGMRGALLSALPALGSEAVMIVGGNDVIEPKGYKNLIETASRSGVQGALLAQRVEQYFPGGYLEVKSDRIVSIVEKPGEGNEPSDLVNIVAHIHNDASVLLTILQGIKGKNDDAYECALDALFKEHTYHAVPYEGIWQAVKYPWHMVQLLPLLLAEITEQSIDPSANIHSTAIIDGNVIVQGGVKVMPHAVIVGPCFIGKNSIVANNALVRGSSIGERCVVGYNTEVKGSVLHSHVWTHITYIGESVIGRNVAFGAGSVTGNFRLDEGEIQSVVKGEKVGTGLVKFGTVIGNDSRIGIQVGINPGIKIGSRSFISSGTLVSEDVPDGCFASMKKGVITTCDNRIAAPTPEQREQFRKKV